MNSQRTLELVEQVPYRSHTGPIQVPLSSRVNAAAMVTQMTKDSDIAGQELGPDSLNSIWGLQNGSLHPAQLRSFQIDVPFFI